MRVQLLHVSQSYRPLSRPRPSRCRSSEYLLFQRQPSCRRRPCRPLNRPPFPNASRPRAILRCFLIQLRWRPPRLLPIRSHLRSLLGRPNGLGWGPSSSASWPARRFRSAHSQAMAPATSPEEDQFGIQTVSPLCTCRLAFRSTPPSPPSRPTICLPSCSTDTPFLS